MAEGLAINRAVSRLTLALLALLALFLLGFFLQTELAITGGRLGVPLDDAWIHYQFARNLSQGRGFSYNPGEPTPGSTAPLWTLLLAGAGLFTGDFLIPSLVLSAGFLLLTIGLTYGFAFSLTGSRLAAALAALGVTLSGRLLWAGLAGMETTAFAALSLAAVWLYSRQGLRPLPALLFGLASQIRPEGHALFALAVLGVWRLGIRDWRLPISNPSTDSGQVPQSPISSIFIYGMIAAPYAIFSLATTGRPLPNTFYAKVGTAHFFSWRTLRETVMLHWHDNPVSLLLIPLGLPPVWRRCRLAVWWLLGLPLLTAVIVDFVWHHGRYTMPLIPFQMVAAAAGAHWLMGRLETGPEPGRRIGDWRLPISILLVLLFVVGGWWRLPGWAEMLGNNANEILEIDVALGHWLAENTPPDALLAVDDIGAITFLSQRRIVDLNGLVSPQMWPAIRAEIGLPRNQVAARILSEIGPDYMVAFPLWHWEIATNTAVSQPIHRVETATHTIIAEQEAIVYRVTWPYLRQAAPQVAREATLGDAIRLLGYDLAPGQPLALTLYWQSLAGVTAEYDVFVHVLDATGQIVAQADQKPVRGLASTHLWQPGDVIRDPYQLDLPPDLPAGTYTINVGMYLRQTGARLPASGEDIVDDAIVLTRYP